MRAMGRSLAQAGIAVDVVTTDDNGPGRLDVPCSDAVIEDGVTYRYFRRQTRFYTFSWPLTRWLAQHVKEYDLLHIHALFSYAAAPAVYWAKRYSVPYIIRPLGVLNRWGMMNRRRYLKKLSYSLIEKHILEGAAAIHYTSDQERLEAKKLGIAQRSVIIPNPAEIASCFRNSSYGNFRTRYPQLADRFIILFLSRLDPIKGLDILLPAFARVRTKHASATLVLAGNGEPGFTENLRHEAARQGLASDILWAGFLTGEQKWAALADADLFVLPSYSENFGVSVVEAMAAKLPVVVSDQVAIHREISDAQAGLVVRCGTDELTDALIKLIADDNLRKQMGLNGRLLAQTKFSSEAATKNLLALYREVCKPAVRPMELAVS
jgi:glycosyltransferase involved in cell wall biosynthesis